MSLEKIIRPFQSNVLPTRVNPTAKPSPNVIARYGESGPAGGVDSNGNLQGQKLTGSLSFSASVYNKKYPKEKKLDQGGIGFNEIDAAYQDTVDTIMNSVQGFFR